jgi:hypothetical protein
MARCRDCDLFALDDVKSKSGAVLSNRVGRCLWVSKERLPLSVRDARPPWVGRMQPNEGKGCQQFRPRKEIS